MGPKKKEVQHGENAWRTHIEEAQLNDETWKVKVILLENAGSDQDRLYLNKFETFAAEEKRFVIKNICKTETIFMINQLGVEKKVKDDNLRVFEEGQAYLKDKKDIPPDIQALVIKHLILKMKEEYLFIRRQRLEVKEGLRQESATMLDKTEIRGTIIVKPPEQVPPTPAKGKGKKGEAEPVPEPTEGKKYNTALRLRGEEWRDKVYVDDYPTDGPNLYVAVSGFQEPMLSACLVDIGIPLTAIVQIRIDASATKVPSSLLPPTKRGQSQTEILTEKSLKFWEDLQQLRIDKETSDHFKNTAFIIFTPPYRDSETLSGNPDKIYDELCFLMYDIQDLTRQHMNYLDNMDIIHIPQQSEDIRCKKYYQRLINDLPLECATVYSVLDCLLQSVCQSHELNKNESISSLSTAQTLIQPIQVVDDKEEMAEMFVKKVFNTLCKSELNHKKYRLTYGQEYEEHKEPIVINYGDIAKYPTFHLGNINLDSIVGSTLFGMPVNRLWCNQNRPIGELEVKINFHVNVLLSCFDREDVETDELNRLIHILACRKLYNNRSSLKKRHLEASTIPEFKKCYLKRSILAEPLSKCPSVFQSRNSIASPSFPVITNTENASNASYGSDPETQHIKFLFDCPDISELVSASEIANKEPVSHMIDDFDFFEDFREICALQIMLDAFNKFNCLDYKYCEVTDCILLMFFNSHDKDGISREEWRSHLPTPLCLQDYFDFILDEHYGWIQDQEKLYDEKIALISQFQKKMSENYFTDFSCLENTDVELELLMEGSLKYQEMTQVEPPSPETSEKGKTSKKTTISPTSTDIDTSKSSKKAKSPASTPKSKPARSAADDFSELSLAAPKKPFYGYDLGDRRVEVFGKDSIYFSRDGTRVSCMYTLTIPMNLEYIILNLVPGNGNNEFWIHRALGEFITPEVLEKCDSFRITTKDQVLINVTKRSYKISSLTAVTSADNIKQKNSAIKSESLRLSQTMQDLLETKLFYSLYVTWPNGLITESIHETNSSDISHVKQYYLIPLPHLNERMRCISLNGEVIIFKKSGHIEVLQPCGACIKILKCERKIVTPQPDDFHSDTSSEKVKKGKGKEKGKEKHSKTSSKSSKLTEIDDDIPDVLAEYKLFVDDFETIETNGLRQKWINEIPSYIETLLIRTATDYCLGEVFSRRMDGTNILYNKDGTQIVTFPNKTRIITDFVIEDDEIYPEWTEEEKEYLEMFDLDCMVEDADVKSKTSTSVASTTSKKIEEEEMKEKERTDGYVSVRIIYTVEHANFTTVTINKANGKVSIESPNNTCVTIDSENYFDLTLDKVTTANFNGENLHINYEACPKCRSSTTCDILIERCKELSSETKPQDNWLRMKDSFCNKIVVNEEGNINVSEDRCSEDTLPAEDAIPTEEPEMNIDERSDKKSEGSVSHSKCREMYQAKTVKFFVLRRDLTCSELLHRALVEQYKHACRWQPWCSISHYDTFGDHRSLLSIMKPVNVTESEKWLMDSKLADKPKHLTYKDLKKDPGKGFYHWMRPYERFEPKPLKPENVLPPRLPRAFVLRTLELQWNENEREQLKGARELSNAILRYRDILASDCETILHIPIIDPRSEDEQRADEVLQALAHRIYEDLKIRMDNDIQNRAKATITTKPPPPEPEEISIEGEYEEDEDPVKALLEERASLVKEVEEVEEISPNLQRYWRRRNEERKEEDFYKYLLREGSVPPYFQNILGGAIWWEMNNTAGEAVEKAERTKMKCICGVAEEGTSRTVDTPIPTDFI